MRVAVELPLFEAVCATDGDSITAREIAKSQDVKEDLVGTLAPLRHEKRERMPKICSLYNARPHGSGCLRRAGLCNYSPNDVTKEFTSRGLVDGVKCLSVPPSASLYHLAQFLDRDC